MSTDRPRVQGYLDPEVHQKFKEFQQERGFKESAALNEILKQFFGISSDLSFSAVPSIPQEAIEKMVKDEVNALFKNKMEEDADFWVNRLSERVSTVEQSLERFINCSHRQIDELKGDLGERVAALEEICQPIEGLAELSKPMEEDTSESLDDSPKPLNLTQLAKRLGVAKSVISNRKGRADFEEWSRGKDPEGKAWQCRKEGQWIKFYPVED